MHKNNKILPPALLLFSLFFIWSCTILPKNGPQDLHGRGSGQPAAAPAAAGSDPDLTCPLEAGLAGPAAMSMELPEPPLEEEQTVALELRELAKLGNWEEGIPAAPAAAPAISYDFPVTVNRQVEYYLDLFQNRQRRSFEQWLARSGCYLPLIQEHLHEAGLPADLAYLPMIESGYSQTAYSQARAMGLWQFISSTARLYGLTVNDYVDERKDPLKSTQAAIAYLADLYEEFGSWELAVAAYNAGSGKIRQAIRKYDTRNFWKLAQQRHLKLETKRYVPKLMAAIIIAKEPAKYGFTNIAYQPPLQYDTVEVPRWTPLVAVALAAGVEVEELRRLNRELRKPFTPPDSASYQIKVPAGKMAEATQNLPRVHATVTTNYKTHTVEKHETLTAICRQYGLTKTIILKANSLRAAELKAGQRLRIPYQTTSYELLPQGAGSSHFLAAAAAEKDFILHKVRPGESISQLATLYNMPPQLIAAWNDLEDINRIKAGQFLALFINNSGQSLAATKQAVAGAAPKRLQLLADQTKKPVSRLNTGHRREPEPAAAKDTGLEQTTDNMVTYYQVRSGDSLWTIAKKHKISPENIKNWNNLQGDVIYPGNRLLLKLTADTGV